jgi:hypothetical protein
MLPTGTGTNRLDPVLSSLLSIKKDQAWLEPPLFKARKQQLA